MAPEVAVDILKPIKKSLLHRAKLLLLSLVQGVITLVRVDHPILRLRLTSHMVVIQAPPMEQEEMEAAEVVLPGEMVVTTEETEATILIFQVLGQEDVDKGLPPEILENRLGE